MAFYGFIAGFIASANLRVSRTLERALNVGNVLGLRRHNLKVEVPVFFSAGALRWCARPALRNVGAQGALRQRCRSDDRAHFRAKVFENLGVYLGHRC